MKKFGMPSHEAFGMSRSVQMAALIVDGESEGGHFDYDNMTWRKPEA